MSLREKLIDLLEPTLESMGYELVELECRPSANNGLVRLYIDKPDGIGLEDCEKVSHQVSGVMDVEDPMPGFYSLEVSSPGLDRPLRTVSHFEDAVGKQVKLELETPIEKRWRFTGTLVAVEDGNITVEVDGEPVTLEIAALKRARIVPEF
ncbi:MAG: ribosome maturation factor RimP [Proteobacteria bacterium]|nr:ribosome maturation factor RimP [Pseudomonadota bacterium]